MRLVQFRDCDRRFMAGLTKAELEARREAIKRETGVELPLLTDSDMREWVWQERGLAIQIGKTPS